MSLSSFATRNPFPSYQEMISAIEKFPDMGMSMAMYAEYGKAHHDHLKKVYESEMDDEICKKAGEAIYSMGGMQAMQMNYYVFYYFSPFAKSRDPDIQGMSRQLESAWDGIGEWQA